jgi:KDO2-lipid IV(A) lauroyltransferase
VQALLFAPVRALFWLVGVLPFPLLYALSDAVAFVLHRVLRYRRGVILGQISACFPDRDAAWHRAVAARFYRHLTDLMVESMKFPHMGPATRAERIRTAGLEVLAPLGAAGRSCIVVLGHLGNWEWGAQGAIPMAEMGIRLHVVYKPPKNPELEKWLRDTRERHRLRLVAMKQVDAFCARHAANPGAEEPYALTLIADQSPAVPSRAAWTTFLGRETPVFYGPERLARLFDLPVYYLECTREGRGRYLFTLTEVSTTPRALPEGAITRAHLALLEEGIRRHPADWLWSHRRWKHRKPEGAHELG